MSGALTLAVRPDGIATLRFDLPDSPVNLMSLAVLEEFSAVLEELASRDDIEKLILLSGKESGFVAGARLEEIEGVDDSQIAAGVARLGQSITNAWENLPFVTVAAIDGACMGGGTELSLASDYIVVSDRPGLRVGLPEIKIGIIPGWGGCVRLPRRIGVRDALDLIVRGGDVDGRRALKLGLADHLVPASQFHRALLTVVVALPSDKPPRRNLTGKKWYERNRASRGVLFEQFRKQTLARTGGRYPAPLRAIEVVRLGIELGAAAGYEAEVRSIGELATSRTCKNLIRVFRLSERARRSRSQTPLPPPRAVGVLGAGAMGSSLAFTVARRANLAVRLLDPDRTALEAAAAASWSSFHRDVRRGRLSLPEAERRQALLRPALGLSGLEPCGLVLENVFEDLDLKQEVLTDVSRIVGRDAVLVTNTSSLTVANIASTPGLIGPERLIGLHFFRPVSKMQLVEVVAGPATDEATIARAEQFVRALGKTPIRVADSPGFLINRILYFYLVEALWLLHEGYPVDEIDRTMEAWGMPMGPFAVLDEIGIDVAVSVARQLGETFGSRLPLPPWIETLVEDGRLGRKSQRGFYHYEGTTRGTVDRDLADRLELQLIPAIHHNREPLDRLTLRMVDEAVRCLDEGVVEDENQLDLAMILGTGFPPFRGGLIRWASRQGPREVLETLERITAGSGDRFHPSDALRRRAERGTF